MIEGQQTVYLSPKVNIVKIKVQSLLCESVQSFGLGNDTFTNGDSEDPWDE